MCGTKSRAGAPTLVHQGLNLMHCFLPYQANVDESEIIAVVAIKEEAVGV
jgi:hypothetical protein